VSVERVYPASSWYVIRTGARQEERAISNLNAWRVETFLPRLRVRRLNPFTGVTTHAPSPMFPQYAFARFDASRLLHQVCYTRGVHSVVRCGGVPARVDDSIIELIQSQINADGFVQMRDGDELKIGDRVKIKDGALNNFTGVFDYRIDNTDRVAILLTAVSYQPRIVIEREFIEKIDPNIAF
jgi:transcription elongation factor/antiterminator RfaH